jgi:hypothetical protein
VWKVLKQGAAVRADAGQANQDFGRRIDAFRAGQVRVDGHALSGPEVMDTCSGFDDRANAVCTGGERTGRVGVRQRAVQVVARVAEQRHCFHAYQHRAGAGMGRVDVTQGKRLAGLVEHPGFHIGAP